MQSHIFIVSITRAIYLQKLIRASISIENTSDCTPYIVTFSRACFCRTHINAWVFMAEDHLCTYIEIHAALSYTLELSRLP